MKSKGVKKFKVKILFNWEYLFAFIIVFAIETFIAIYVKGGFIRHYLGDVLVVVLIYCFIKIFLKNDLKLLPVYIFLFAVLVEVGQNFNIIERLNLSGTYASIIIGATFDIQDIVCYFVGCLGIWIFETIKRKRKIM